MANYKKTLEKCFVCRTNKIIQEYSGKYDATILLNSMLGLLVMPFEKYNDMFKEERNKEVFSDLFTRVECDGRMNCYGQDYDEFWILRFLRNAIAHLNIKPYQNDRIVHGYKFISYEMDKYCEEKKGTCGFKNVLINPRRPIFEISLSLEELKELASLIRDYVIELENDKGCIECINDNKEV